VRLSLDAPEEKRGRKKKRGKGAVDSGGAKKRRTKGRRREKPERQDTEEFLEAAGNPKLVEALRSWRLDEARRRRVPAFRILTNRALAALAERRPRTQEELLEVHGIGPKLAEKYGRLLVAICVRTG
jgi:DNA topoisomerase-3